MSESASGPTKTDDRESGWQAVQGSGTPVSVVAPQPPTIFELASKIKMRKRGKRGRARDSAPFITDGVKPNPFRNEVGFRVVQPEEISSLKVPVLDRSTGKIGGYQRILRPNHAFDIAWALMDNKQMPVLEVSLDEYGDAYITDGQHRAVAALIARRPLKAVIEQRSYAEAREMFVNQTFAKKLDKSHMVLVGTDAMSLYVQDALTDAKHPWHDMVHESDKHGLAPSAAHRLVTMYGCDTVGSLNPQLVEKVSTRFDTDRANELAELIGVFGRDGAGNFSRVNHPFAYQASVLGALGQAAVHILLRADQVHPGPDKERWMRHMPAFNWAGNAHIKNQRQYTEELLNHWNKKMSARRVKRVIYSRLDSA